MELRAQVDRLAKMYEHAVGKRPRVETKKISLTLTLSQAKALDAAYKSKTTKSKLVGHALEHQKLTAVNMPQLTAS